MNEKLLERKFCNTIKTLGGIAIKFYSMSFTGMPDRIVLMPGGKIWFAEIKTTGKGLSPRQKIVKAILEKLGFTVFVIDSEETLNQAIAEIQK